MRPAVVNGLRRILASVDNLLWEALHTPEPEHPDDVMQLRGRLSEAEAMVRRLRGVERDHEALQVEYRELARYAKESKLVPRMGKTGRSASFAVAQELAGVQFPQPVEATPAEIAEWEAERKAERARAMEQNAADVPPRPSR